jgi:hypothetical protein
MKKISFFALALTATVFVNAQSKQPTLRTEMEVTPRLGIKGGVNLAKMNHEGYSSASEFESKSKTSYNGGLFINIPVGTNFRFQPEVVYSSQGGKNTQVIQTPTGNITSNYEMDLNYINVPLMLQLQSTTGVFLELGPQFGYLINAKNKSISSGAGTSNSEMDIKDQLNKLDIGASGGIGYLSRIGLGINARYNYGFTNVLDENNANYVSGQKLKNRVYQVGLFFQFGAAK